MAMLAQGQPSPAPKKKRKRGGLAGLWDRNKKVIKPVAMLASGLVNPALAAGVGAAFGGLDREGKGGIGIDLGGALGGAATGYALGGLGAAGKGAVKGALGAGRNWFGGAKSGFMDAGRAYLNRPVGEPLTETTKQFGKTVTRDVPRTLPRVIARGARRATDFAKANPMAAGLGLQTAGNLLAANQQAALTRDQIRYDRELNAKREADRRALFEALMPLFAARMGV